MIKYPKGVSEKDIQEEMARQEEESKGKTASQIKYELAVAAEEMKELMTGTQFDAARVEYALLHGTTEGYVKKVKMEGIEEQQKRKNWQMRQLGWKK